MGRRGRARAPALLLVALAAAATGSSEWSPDDRDGRTIVFGRRGQVFRMGADGTALHRLAGHAGGPALSPDGRTIAFLGGGGGAWLMDADGGSDFAGMDWGPDPAT
jgi:hypothetical protein